MTCTSTLKVLMLVLSLVVVVAVTWVTYGAARALGSRVAGRLELPALISWGAWSMLAGGVAGTLDVGGQGGTVLDLAAFGAMAFGLRLALVATEVAKQSNRKG